MSTLRPKEKATLERLFDMSGGYVLNFSDSTIDLFFAEYDIEIHSEKYRGYGTSKANKLRKFWDSEPDWLVGQILLGLIERYEAWKEQVGSLIPEEDQEKTRILLENSRKIAQRLVSGSPQLNPLREAAVPFDSVQLLQQIQRMEGAIYSDPSLAIGTAKEMIETCCKTILADLDKSLDGKPDVTELTKATFKALNLMPDDVSDAKRGARTIRTILQNLATVGKGLAELRNLYGTGHGPDGKATGLTPRHAKLAAGAAATLATFLFETHLDTNKPGHSGTRNNAP